MKKIAVVILNWNGKDLLRKFLPSIITHSPQAEIYVADNASDDTTVEMLKLEFPSVKIIRNNENYGFAEGYNEALKQVNEPILALVNSDVEATENWLSPIIELFEKEPNTAVIQPKILDYKHKSYFEYAGAGGGFIDKFGFPFCRGRIFETLEQDKGQYNDTTTIFWASGACFFIRNEVFKNLGGFDCRFFAHQEEIDLCWRIRNQNYTIKYCGNSTIYHIGGATLQVVNPKKTFLNFRNSLLMLAKNLPKNQLIFIIFIRLFLDGIAGIHWALRGKFKHTFAIIKAHFSFYALLPYALKNRNLSPKTDYYTIDSIVFAYFIKKKKIFTALF